MQDEELVRRAVAARQGDLRAFDELVKRHQSRVQTNCRFLSGSAEDAKDLSQEVFVKAYFNLKSFESRSTFATWIQRIKVNHCLNHLRKGKGKVFVDIDDEAMAVDESLRDNSRADDAIEAREARERITEVLDRMSETLRIPLIMRDMDGYSYQDIADELDVGLSAVKMRIARARGEFRTMYAKG